MGKEKKSIPVTIVGRPDKPAKAPAKMEIPKPAPAAAQEPVKTEPMVAAVPSGNGADKPSKPARRQSAEDMGKKQRSIAVSEFFYKNRHLLGFDNPRKALLTTIKEAVDNSLDACEEAGILPDLEVKVEMLSEDRYRVTVADNGPGIVPKQVGPVFGKLLYGSKFHRLKMSRGQQGIGISAAGMYAMMTTGKSVQVLTRVSPKKPAYYCELQIDTKQNAPIILKEDENAQCPFDHGTRVTMELQARYQKGRAGIDEYIEQTAIANPHTQILYTPPGGDPITFPRAVNELPPEPKEIQPHPHGIELGTLLKMLQDTSAGTLASFLKDDFCKVSPGTAGEIITKAGLRSRQSPRDVEPHQAEALYKTIQQTKIPNPPTNCLAPIGARQILAGLLKEIKAEFFTAETRDPTVYRGMPFQIEVGIAYGGELGRDPKQTDPNAAPPAADEKAEPVSTRLIRFANRVPLQYQQSACATFKAAVDEVDWKIYGLAQSRGALPAAPLVIVIHLASVWVPFTSESKEAIADYDVIREEMKLALQECGRKLRAYLRRVERVRKEGNRRSMFLRYIGEVVGAIGRITHAEEKAVKKLETDLLALARKKTEQADLEFDQDGKAIKADEEKPDENTIIVEPAGTEGPTASGSPA